MLKEIWEAGKLGELAKAEEIGGEVGDRGAGLGAGPGMGMGKFGLGLGEIDRGMKGWWMIGLGEEGQGRMLGEGAMFTDVGELGLECLVRTEITFSARV